MHDTVVQHALTYKARGGGVFDNHNKRTIKTLKPKSVAMLRMIVCMLVCQLGGGGGGGGEHHIFIGSKMANTASSYSHVIYTGRNETMHQFHSCRA